jgi:hypothetical protein
MHNLKSIEVYAHQLSVTVAKYLRKSTDMGNDYFGLHVIEISV